MNSPVDKIKERLSIVDVISSYITIEQSGKNYKARCPFHNEKTPSFFISTDRSTYYCFGCGEKGDIFSFVQKFEGTDFVGALKLLAEKAGIPLVYENKGQTDQTERYYKILEEATVYFEKNLENNPAARSYLLERGLTENSIANFRIGYAPNTWRSVSEHLINKGYNKGDLEIVGLVKNKNDGYYDRFRGRIMFPLSDSSGRVIAFSGRIFEEEKKMGDADVAAAKYLNSPETPLFNKSNVLYGIDKAKLAIKTRGYSIIVEGQFDLILSHQASFENTVAVSGTAFTDTIHSDNDKVNNLGLIRRLSSNIIFAYDGDRAGVRAATRSAMIALSLDMQVKIAVLPESKDPADIIREDVLIWKDIIKNSVNIISFHINRICQAETDQRIRGKQIREIVFPLLQVIKSEIEKASYIHEIFQKTGIPEMAILHDYESFLSGQSISIADVKPQTEKVKVINTRRQSLEQRLIGMIFWLDERTDQPALKKLCDSFKSDMGEEIYNLLLAKYQPDCETLAFEADLWYGTEHNTIARDLGEIILNLEEEILIEQSNSLREEILHKEQNNDTESLGETLSDYQKIVGKIEEIKNRRSQ